MIGYRRLELTEGLNQTRINRGWVMAAIKGNSVHISRSRIREERTHIMMTIIQANFNNLYT